MVGGADLNLADCEVQKCLIISDSYQALGSLTSHGRSQSTVQFQDNQFVEQILCLGHIHFWDVFTIRLYLQ